MFIFHNNLSCHLTFCYTKILHIQILLKNIFLIAVKIYSMLISFISANYSIIL
ncbi:hypothetical protein BBUWI9123_J0007 (plasmid) [Borreliella burgdorferi WI91-23]|nr:hypothetical protein BBU64B_J0008 [Borreliella burgdorferi 64b]ACN55727.1 hypothetical protein BBUWI9123_J0007 [Borreliella burgdorferi WI91-23]